MMRLFNKKALKNLSENELIIKWGDELIFHTNEFGQISKDSFLLDNVFDLAPPTQEEIEWRKVDPSRSIRNYILSKLKSIHKNGSLNLDPIGKELDKYEVGVKNHLLSHGYIESPIWTERFWRISDEGKLVRKSKGHYKYQRTLNSNSSVSFRMWKSVKLSFRLKTE